MNINDEIRNELVKYSDKKYGDFQLKLIPGLKREEIIGVRTPVLRKMAKKYGKREETALFLDHLPHEYFDEMQLHAFIISLEKDFDKCIERVEEFLPFINNWATCDQLSPAVFRKRKDELLPFILKWIRSHETYTVRFGIGMLMSHFLNDRFRAEYPAFVSEIRSDEYYVNMMIAWYFATALAKQYDEAVKYLEEKRLSKWVHNRTIQKAVESRRIDEDTKNYLRTLRIK